MIMVDGLVAGRAADRPDMLVERVLGEIRRCGLRTAAKIVLNRFPHDTGSGSPPARRLESDLPPDALGKAEIRGDEFRHCDTAIPWC